MNRPVLRAMAATAFILATVAGADRSLANPYTATVCSGPTQHQLFDSWFSVPTRSWIGTAEELCRAIGPEAISVTSFWPEDWLFATGPEEYVYRCPSGTEPGTCGTVGATPPPPEPGCSTSSCFCLDEGEGFGVVLTPGIGSLSFTVDGCYSSVPITVTPSNYYLLSIPQDTSLATFGDLGAWLGLNIPFGEMDRLVCQTDSFLAYLPGTVLSFNTPLQPGEAYRIGNGTLLTFNLPASTEGCSCTETSVYDIHGTGTGTNYAWWLDDRKDEVYSPGELYQADVLGSPPGAPAAVLAANIVASINAIGPPQCNASVLSGVPTRIEITCTPCSYDLFLAPADPGGTPPFPQQCPAVTATCSFNPAIRKVFPEQDAGDVGDTLRVAYGAAPGDLHLTWGPSCTRTDGDYGIYEGTLGSWYSHQAIHCSTGGATSATVTPRPTNAYYLVAPHNAFYEGHYGKNSAGAMRPQGGGACEPQQAAPTCP